MDAEMEKSFQKLAGLTPEGLKKSADFIKDSAKAADAIFTIGAMKRLAEGAEDRLVTSEIITAAATLLAKQVVFLFSNPDEMWEGIKNQFPKLIAGMKDAKAAMKADKAKPCALKANTPEVGHA